MASVIQIGDRWRVQVRRKGVRSRAKTFDTEAEARKWADLEEKRIALVKRGVMLDPMMRPTPYQMAGVYVLYRGAEVRYVGRSVHIHRRLNDHDRRLKDWDGFRIWPCADWQQAAELERKLIEKLQPPLNLQMANKGLAA